MKRKADSQETHIVAKQPKRSLTEQLWENHYFISLVVQQSGFSLSLVPEALCTAELCQQAVQQNGYALECVPKALRTAELCQQAVQQDGRALKYVPETLRTAELCQRAVQQDGYVLEYVPEALRTAELCQRAVQQKGNVLEDIPKAYFQDPAFCLTLVKVYGVSLVEVPDRFIDEAFVNAVLDHYRPLYFQQRTGHSLFKNYSSSSFFSQWQQLEAQQEKRELSSLVTFHFQS